MLTQALTETWLEVESQNYNPPITSLVWEKVFKPRFMGITTDEAVAAANLAELNRVLDVYEARLSKQSYLAGQEFSLADLSHISNMWVLVNMAQITQPLDTHPAVKAWYERITSRPAWIKVSA